MVCGISIDRSFTTLMFLTDGLRLSPWSRKMENSEHHNISTHDKAVLTRIFSPNLPYGDLLDEESQQQNVLGKDNFLR